MKHALFFSLALLLCGCRNANSLVKDHSMQSEVTYPKEKTVSNDRFDFDEFRKLRAKAFVEWNKREDTEKMSSEDEYGFPLDKTLPDGTKVEILPPSDEKNTIFLNGADKYKEKYYQVTITPPPPALFKTIKDYHMNGTIARIVSHHFIGSVYGLSGIAQIYDNNGVLEKTINYDKRYDGMINVDALLQILIKNKFLNPYSENDRMSYTIQFDEKRMIWTAYGNRVIEIYARTGKILSVKDYVDD